MAKPITKDFVSWPLTKSPSAEDIAMDMGDPFIRAVREKVPHVAIVFNLFHVVSHINQVIDNVRKSAYRKASKAHKDVIKGIKYLLLKNRPNIRRSKDRKHLEQLLKLNKTISTIMILMEKLKHIWSNRSRIWANKAIDQWCALTRTVGHPTVPKFASTLERYRYGIPNHCDYPIHTGKREGVNNKIKFVKRRAYDYHDTRYFSLKIMGLCHLS